ncbi:hypothetical protein RvY_08318 [Ramazzottius varieornatus]|uniref:Uncharacterized protein n=1 Tax=Ramazzottius varieornatus TaxID=947166 RepID=A0A1D1V5F6_RAMVA|nr:hypothetical protein RvY_08318 [Ramazzottius varieornatus]
MEASKYSSLICTSSSPPRSILLVRQDLQSAPFVSSAPRFCLNLCTYPLYMIAFFILCFSQYRQLAIASAGPFADARTSIFTGSNQLSSSNSTRDGPSTPGVHPASCALTTVCTGRSPCRRPLFLGKGHSALPGSRFAGAVSSHFNFPSPLFFCYHLPGSFPLLPLATAIVHILSFLRYHGDICTQC